MQPRAGGCPGEPQPAVGAAPPRGARRLYVVYVARAVYWPLYVFVYTCGGRRAGGPLVPGGGFGSARHPHGHPRRPRARPARPRRRSPADRRAGAPGSQERGGARGAATPRRTGRAGVLAVTEFTNRTDEYREFYTRDSNFVATFVALVSSLEPPGPSWSGRARLVRYGPVRQKTNFSTWRTRRRARVLLHRACVRTSGALSECEPFRCITVPQPATRVYHEVAW